MQRKRSPGASPIGGRSIASRGIAPILFAERPALAVCGRYGRVNHQDDTDERNGTIDLVMRPREVKQPDGTKLIVWRAGIAHAATCGDWLVPHPPVRRE
jgi:hypothetical protein